MVTRSIDDYNKHKEDIRKHYLGLGVKRKSVNKFMNYYSKLYDSHKRTFIPFKLAWWLFDRKNWVTNKNQHYWFAIIGRTGGEGKTTLGEHILYFLDPTFTPDRITLNYDSFIKKVKEITLIQDFPGILLDEPENKTHPQSEKGREMKDILGKIRQLNLLVGNCANNLMEVPSFVYDRLSTICYVNNKHRFWFWDSMKDSPKYTIIEDLKTGFKREGHAIFKNKKILSRAYLKNQQFSDKLPFDIKKYLGRKNKDLMNDINHYLSNGHKKVDPKKALNKRLKGQGRTQKERAEIVGVSTKTIYRFDQKDKLAEE